MILNGEGVSCKPNSGETNLGISSVSFFHNNATITLKGKSLE